MSSSSAPPRDLAVSNLTVYNNATLNNAYVNTLISNVNLGGIPIDIDPVSGVTIKNNLSQNFLAFVVLQFTFSGPASGLFPAILGTIPSSVIPSTDQFFISFNSAGNVIAVFIQGNELLYASEIPVVNQSVKMIYRI